MSYESNILAKKLITESRNPIVNYGNVYNDKISNHSERRGLAFNPTFISNIFLNWWIFFLLFYFDFFFERL